MNCPLFNAILKVRKPNQEKGKMAIRHTAVSYYGWNYAEHARADFKEMREHGCDTVILAITEFDMDFWFPNLNAVIAEAHAAGLSVCG